MHFGLESLSRGASYCAFCDKSPRAVNIIKQNIEKTKFTNESKILTLDYKKCLNELKNSNIKFDLVFLDPPYESNLIFLSLQEIIELNLLNEDALVVAETDNEDMVVEKIEKLKINIVNIKRYGRVKLLFIQ